MIANPLDRIQDPEIKDVLNHIQEEAQGQVLILSSAPTATEPLLSDGESGLYSGILYIRRNGVIYEFTPSATTTIT